MNEQPKTLLEAVRYFSDADRAFDFVKSLRWPTGEPVCPHCGCLEHSFLTTRRIWKCKSCRRQFSIKVGSIFEDSPIGFDKWLPAMWLLANSKNSISSYEVGRALGVTQKTAWFMLHRLREAMRSGTFEKMGGVVEVDETYIGGKGENMHRYIIRLNGPIQKIAVQGVRERESGTVHAEVVDGRNLTSNVVAWVKPRSTVNTDEARAYRNLRRNFTHKTVSHSGPIAHRYVNGDASTNGIENFWSILKRAIKGTQIHISKPHTSRYVIEREFAYNYRNESDLTRMRIALSNVGGRRLTWNELTQ